MKNLLFVYLLLFSNFIFSQKNNWQEFSKEKIISVDISKTGTYKVQNYSLDVVWDEHLSYSENIGYYGGIKKMTILKENRKIQVIENIEDNVALGTINFDFYDYNLDGYLDFNLPLNCGSICWKKYYLYNPTSNKFEHIEDWDYLRIQKIDKKNKMILTQPDGNAVEDNRKTYKIDGLKIIKIK